ncbi:MAG: O-antigen ligase family protein [Thermoanaerobaculia bacterium]
MARAKRSVPTPPARAAAPAPTERLSPALWLLIALFFGVALAFDPAGRESFRLPKELLAEILGLASLALVALRLRRLDRWPTTWPPALVAFLPFAAAIALAGLASPHPAHAGEGVTRAEIAILCLAGWSAGFRRGELARAIDWLVAPAALLAAIGIAQYFGWLKLFEFAETGESARFDLTSLAGNVGVFGAAMVLPALALQRRIAQGRRRAFAVVLLALLAFGLALSQTLAALAALLAGSSVFWLLRLPARKRWMAVAAAAAAVAVLAVAVPELGERLAQSQRRLLRGDWDALLSGRVDAWKVAVWMLREHPWVGVGPGAFVTEFVPGKLALLQQGVKFYPFQLFPVFAEAHNEILQLGAECGALGLLALAWAVKRSVGRVASLSAETPDRAFAWGAFAALAVLSMAHFPFRVAMVSYPFLVVLAWVFAGDEEQDPP